MKSFRRVPVFEQLEQKRLLAADTCEQEPIEATSSAVEAAPLAIEPVESVSGSLSAPVMLQSTSTTNANHSQNEDDDDEESEDEQESDSEESDDEEDESDEQQDDDEEDETDEQQDDEDEEETDEHESDDEEEEEEEDSSDDEEMNDDDDEDMDDDDSDDATDMDESDDDDTDDSTDMDDMDDDDMDDATDMEEMDDDDEDELDDDDNGTTPTAAAATASLDPALESAIEQPLFNVIASSLSQSAVPGAAASQAEEAPQTTSDAHTADLLLAVTENGEPREPESTEFVGASDQRDAASEVLELPPSLTEEDVKGPSPN